MIDDLPARSRPRPLLRWALALLVAFVAGTIAMGYALTHWDAAARFLRPAEVEPVELAAAPQSPVPARPPLVVTPLPIGEVNVLDTRVAELEQRIGAIDARARVAGVNADRAEALLVALAARRAIDRGVALGYLEPLLRDRFGAAQPQAVATILAAARQPVTLDELRAGLAAVKPALLGAEPSANWWTGFKREMAGLVVLRRAGVPGGQPGDRAARAEVALAAGHVDRALVEVARLPGRDAAAAWIAAARRYVAARQALDMLDAAALLAPRPEPVAPPADPAAPAIAETGDAATPPA